MSTAPELEAMKPGVETPASAWSDERLVRECLAGNEEAWRALIARYKRLIYSIPFRYGATADDAGDIFQAVCLELFAELANLRKVESLRSWLITVTIHKSFHWKKQQRPADLRLDGLEPDEAEEIVSTEPPEWREQLEHEHIVREAVARLSGRCGEMIRLLFFADPALPYAEVAARLGLATGSIGFIRGRCLQRLQKILTGMGFK